MNEGSPFSIQHLFCCFPSYCSLLLGKVIQPKANELEHPLVFGFLSRQDWACVTRFFLWQGVFFLQTITFPYESPPVLSRGCSAALVALQVDNGCMVTDRKRFLPKDVACPWGYPSARVPGDAGEQRCLIKFWYADSWWPLWFQLRSSQTRDCPVWLQVVPSGLHFPLENAVCGAVQPLQGTNICFSKNRHRDWTCVTLWKRTSLPVWHNSHWHERVRHNNHISGKSCKGCISFEDIGNFDGNLVGADEEKTWITDNKKWFSQLCLS